MTDNKETLTMLVDEMVEALSTLFKDSLETDRYNFNEVINNKNEKFLNKGVVDVEGVKKSCADISDSIKTTLKTWATHKQEKKSMLRNVFNKDKNIENIRKSEQDEVVKTICNELSKYLADTIKNIENDKKIGEKAAEYKKINDISRISKVSKKINEEIENYSGNNKELFKEISLNYENSGTLEKLKETAVEAMKKIIVRQLDEYINRGFIDENVVLNETLYNESKGDNNIYNVLLDIFEGEDKEQYINKTIIKGLDEYATNFIGNEYFDNNGDNGVLLYAKINEYLKDEFFNPKKIVGDMNDLTELQKKYTGIKKYVEDKCGKGAFEEKYKYAKYKYYNDRIKEMSSDKIIKELQSGLKMKEMFEQQLDFINDKMTHITKLAIESTHSENNLEKKEFGEKPLTNESLEDLFSKAQKWIKVYKEVGNLEKVDKGSKEKLEKSIKTWVESIAKTGAKIIDEYCEKNDILMQNEKTVEFMSKLSETVNYLAKKSGIENVLDSSHIENFIQNEYAKNLYHKSHENNFENAKDEYINAKIKDMSADEIVEKLESESSIQGELIQQMNYIRVKIGNITELIIDDAFKKDNELEYGKMKENTPEETFLEELKELYSMTKKMQEISEKTKDLENINKKLKDKLKELPETLKNNILYNGASKIEDFSDNGKRLQEITRDPKGELKKCISGIFKLTDILTSKLGKEKTDISAYDKIKDYLPDLDGQVKVTIRNFCDKNQKMFEETGAIFNSYIKEINNLGINTKEVTKETIDKNAEKVTTEEVGNNKEEIDKTGEEPIPHDNQEKNLSPIIKKEKKFPKKRNKFTELFCCKNVDDTRIEKQKKRKKEQINQIPTKY